LEREEGVWPAVEELGLARGRRREKGGRIKCEEMQTI
jgi:hypothetical protein